MQKLTIPSGKTLTIPSDKKLVIGPPELQIPGCLSNLDTQFLAAGGLASGDLVGDWYDSSGNGRNATQGTTGSKPTYTTNSMNGYDAVVFDGSRSFMYSVISGFQFSITFVGATTKTNWGALIGGRTLSNDANGWQPPTFTTIPIGQQGTGIFMGVEGSNYIQSGGFSNITDGKTHVSTMVLDVSGGTIDLRFYQDGVGNSHFTKSYTNGPITAVDYAICSRLPDAYNNQWQGPVGQIMFHDVLSDSNALALHSILKKKWGIS